MGHHHTQSNMLEEIESDHEEEAPTIGNLGEEDLVDRNILPHNHQTAVQERRRRRAVFSVKRKIQSTSVQSVESSIVASYVVELTRNKDARK